MSSTAAPSSPVALPRSSWPGTLKRTVTEFRDDKLQHWAASLTFYAVLSLFPALLVLVSLVGLFADPQRVTQVLTDVVTELGPSSATETFQGPIDQITSNRGTAGVLAIAGAAAALWAASGYVSAFADASNVIYEVEEGRPFWKLKPFQLAITLVIVLLVALTAVGLVLTGPLATAVGSAVGLGDTAVAVWRIAKWPAMLMLVMTVLAILYYSSPNAKVGGFRWVTGGSVLALVAWALASGGFALYVANFGSYNKTYGALAGVVVFLLWLWITNLAVLLGAQFNAETERARELHAGVPHARDRLQLPEREAPA